MKTPNDGGPAFPVPTIFNPHSGEPMHTGAYWDGNGMTMRAYIATAALSNMEMKHDGRYNNADRSSGFPELEAKWLATAAVRYADALIAELGKEAR